MSFTGNLEHLPLVDVMQLLHTTRKSGTLCIKGKKGESRIVFSEGSIVGASHLNNKYLIGKVLVEMDLITEKVLEQTLEDQKKAGANRKPLIATLLETKRISMEDARKGLKQLIEMTVVELVGWKKGVFTLDIETITVSDECSYTISDMSQEISLDTQMVLMDALRVFDEKQRDGEVEEDEELSLDNEWGNEEGAASGKEASESQATATILSEDDLGLADLDQIERSIPEVFKGLQAFDPADFHRQILNDTLGDFSKEEREELVTFLSDFSGNPGADQDAANPGGQQSQAVILFSRDEFIKHAIMTVCKKVGAFAYDTGDKADLYDKIEHCVSNKISPVLVFDGPDESKGGLSSKELAALRKEGKEKYPLVSTVQLLSSPDYSFSIKSFDDGVRTVFPKPSKETQKETFIEDTIKFLEAFQSYIKSFFHEQGHSFRLKDNILTLRKCENSQDVLSVLLDIVSEVCERTITFVRKKDFVGVSAKGMDGKKSGAITAAAKLKLPLSQPSIVSEVAEGGDAFLGKSDDSLLKKQIFDEIGVPQSSNVLLLPVQSRGKTVALVYGDFGDEETVSAHSDTLSVIASQAGLVLENLLYRKQLENNS